MSAHVIIYHDKMGFNRDEHEIPHGSPLVSSLIAIYPEGFKCQTSIYKGTVSDECFIDLNDHEDDGYPVEDGDVFIIMHRQGWVHVAVGAVAFVVSYIAARYLAPSIPDTPITITQSPNRQSVNEVSDQQNAVRGMQRRPDVYGQDIIVYPDLIAPQVTRYLNSRTQQQTSYMSIGNGNFEIEQFRIGKSPISQKGSQGADASFWDYKAPNSTDVLDYLEFDQSEEVNGQVLSGENVRDIPATAITGAISGGTTDQAFIFLQTNLQSYFSRLLEDDTFTISGSGTAADGTWTFLKYQATGNVTCKEATVGQFSIPSGTITATNGAGSNIVGPFILADTAEKIYFDFLFPKGLKKTVTINFELTNIVTAWVGTFFLNVERDSFDQQALTTAINAVTNETGVALEDRLYSIKVKRSDTEANDAATPEETKWTSVAAVKDFSAPFPVSVMEVARMGDTQPIRGSRNKLNATVNRLINEFDFSTGLFTGSEVKSAFCDEIFMHHAVFACGRKVGNIAYQELQSSMAAVRAVSVAFVRFQYTFSSKNALALDELNLICNAGRVMMYEEGNTLRFYPIVAQSFPKMIFTRRHKSPNSETRNNLPKLPSDPDYISLEYYDFIDDAWRTINYGGTWGATNEIKTREKKITLNGATNWDQAYNRAAIEYNIIALQRRTCTSTVTREALSLALGDRILHVDGNDLKSVDGDILGYSDDGVNCILTLSEGDLTNRLSGGSYTVILQDTLGTTPDLSQPFNIISENQIQVLSYINPDLTPVVTNQARSTFSFIEDGKEKANDYVLISKKPVGNGLAQIEMQNYDEDIFIPDTLTPPPKPPLRPA